MLCQRCKKNTATVNYVEIVNGKKFACNLCAACYDEMYGELNSKANNDYWSSLFAPSKTPKKTCPVCGTSFADYENSGLLGCASCYDVFKDELLPAIRRIQGKVTHVGAPSANRDEYGLYRTLKTLQEQLETALKEKRYTDAGKLNRRINEINKKLFDGGGEDD